MKKSALILLVCCLPSVCPAQTDYLILEDGTLLKGYIKTMRDINDGQPLLELWQTKTDKSPVRYRRSDVEEFAMSGDTFRILKNFQPFYGEEFSFMIFRRKS